MASTADFIALASEGCGRGLTQFLNAWLHGTIDPAWDADRIEELVRRLETTDGVQFPPGKRNWPRTPLAPPADPHERQLFVAIVDDVLSDFFADDRPADPERRSRRGCSRR